MKALRAWTWLSQKFWKSEQIEQNGLSFLHWIIEWHELEETWKIILFQPPAVGRVFLHWIRLPRAPSNLALNTSKFLSSSPQMWSAPIRYCINKVKLPEVFGLKMFFALETLCAPMAACMPSYRRNI